MYCIKCNEWINFERNIKNYDKIILKLEKKVL